MYEIAGLTKEYPGVRALDDVSLRIDDNETVSIRGESGCGKSTLLKILAGLELPDTGSILKDGVPLPPDPHRRGISMVFQDSILFNNMTVRDNIAFGAPRRANSGKGRYEYVDMLAEAYGIEDLLKRYPYQISGGQARRVALTRALACERELLLLDEPFTNLDREWKDKVMEKTKELCSGRCAVLLVTHNEEEASFMCGRHLYMEAGLLVKSLRG